MSITESYRVLALDGGGIKGTYAAAFLAEVERVTGKNVVDHFDLIAGTSTGGIIALGLGLGLPAQQILEFYETRGPEIFPLTEIDARWGRRVRHFFATKHAVDPLRNALTEVFGERVIGESVARLLIPAFDGTSGDVKLFKTCHHPKFTIDFEEKAVDVALATSAAPTFLPAFTARTGMVLVDGGVWANCPASVAVVEALTTLERPIGSIDLLSIGTTDGVLHVSRRHRRGGLWTWKKFATEVMMHAQTKGSLSQAKLLTQERIFRVTETVDPKRFSLDDPRDIVELKALGVKAATHHAATIATRYLYAPVKPFEPYRGPRSPVNATA